MTGPKDRRVARAARRRSSDSERPFSRIGRGRCRVARGMCVIGRKMVLDGGGGGGPGPRGQCGGLDLRTVKRSEKNERKVGAPTYLPSAPPPPQPHNPNKTLTCALDPRAPTTQPSYAAQLQKEPPKFFYKSVTPFDSREFAATYPLSSPPHTQTPEAKPGRRLRRRPSSDPTKRATRPPFLPALPPPSSSSRALVAWARASPLHPRPSTHAPFSPLRD